MLTISKILLVNMATGYKHAMYWWAAVMVPDFNLLWQAWHEEVSRHIHMLGVSYALSECQWKKNNLSDGEIALIFAFIMDQKRGLPNLKQHWAAMLLTWLTAVRPGSIVVTIGYEKSASLGMSAILMCNTVMLIYVSQGLPGKKRPVDETLRWSDIQFVNMLCGIAVQVKLRYHKGYRNPNKNDAVIDAVCIFLFLPTQGEKLEFDLPIILFGIAYERGLFKQSLDEILNSPPSTVFIEKDPIVDQQAASAD